MFKIVINMAATIFKMTTLANEIANTTITVSNIEFVNLNKTLLHY